MSTWSVDMPKDARLLGITQQSARVVLWALVDPSLESVKRRFMNVESDTAYAANEGLTDPSTKYVGAIQTEQDGYFFVKHVFDMG